MLNKNRKRQSGNFTALINDMDENDGFALVRELRRKFGWAVGVYTRGDVESMWPEDGPKLDDAMWERFSTHKWWDRLLEADDNIWERVGERISWFLEEERNGAD